MVAELSVVAAFVALPFPGTLEYSVITSKYSVTTRRALHDVESREDDLASPVRGQADVRIAVGRCAHIS
jgi:hypothetical protein